MKSLGITLKEARDRNDLTLRQVDEATGISSAYLSQLENDKIKKPSANVLYKLATLYGEQLNNLLKAAGIIQTSNIINEDESEEMKWANRLAYYAKGLTPDEQEEIVNWIKFKVQNKKHD
ncbi:Helix-turn-helix [Chitinophaga ginsengisegetis]|uniref:Helix-turn-helix n=1 Tax=Chitinophaga ginsengisegetis TaxID=393003 RepID=A0A1T5NJ66_9BACT|nr:helix-turn-helix transcriptional regulator [Chitinophaga ginsengisegetis]SKD00501.1 Helix-turn-helix [Chitinophaga ginsengisegetis]